MNMIHDPGLGMYHIFGFKSRNSNHIWLIWSLFLLEDALTPSCTVVNVITFEKLVMKSFFGGHKSKTPDKILRKPISRRAILRRFALLRTSKFLGSRLLSHRSRGWRGINLELKNFDGQGTFVCKLILRLSWQLKKQSENYFF